jgi:SAM-dependent methyltransferase
MMAIIAPLSHWIVIVSTRTLAKGAVELAIVVESEHRRCSGRLRRRCVAQPCAPITGGCFLLAARCKNMRLFPPMLQDAIFSQGEGDAYFERNRQAYRAEHDPILQALTAQHIHPREVLEIGASSGARLAKIQERYEAKATAVEPSEAAVAHGRKSFPELQFFIGTAKSLPVPGETYDCVIVNAVFHWIDRKSLLGSVAEIDRVLKQNGYLLIGDFAPYSPKKVRYHHRPDLEIYTYKQDYSAIFLATAGYILLAQQMIGHTSSEPCPEISEYERYSITVLEKLPGGIYSEMQAKPTD